MEPLPAKVSCHLDALQSSTFRLNFNFADKNYTFSFQLNFVESFYFTLFNLFTCSEREESFELREIDIPNAERRSEELTDNIRKVRDQSTE